MDLQRQLSRFKRLPESQDVWEGAIVALPTWVDTPGGDPYRPHAAVWTSTSRQLANLKMLDEAAAAADEVALAAFAEMGTSAKLAGYRPRAVRVKDPRLADMLRDTLAALAIPIDVVEKLPAVDAFVHAMADTLTETPIPAALDAPGVTPARLAAFADAAKRFFDAAPWRHLQDGDLIKVEKPKAGRGLALFGVLGGAGEQFGLGFFSSAAQYRDHPGRSAARDDARERRRVGGLFLTGMGDRLRRPRRVGDTSAPSGVRPRLPHRDPL